MRRFAQYEFIDSTLLEVHGLDEFGFVYYPFSCVNSSKKCKVHIFIHGCSQYYTGPTGDSVFMSSGWADYATSNNLVILFP